jgi:hypothetical protein
MSRHREEMNRKPEEKMGVQGPEPNASSKVNAEDAIVELREPSGTADRSWGTV